MVRRKHEHDGQFSAAHTGGELARRIEKMSAAPSPSVIPTPMAPRQRLDSVDLLRGLVMVIMALDHVRDYLTNVRFLPEDLSQTTPALFMTRWVTRFCAPTFMFLVGVGMSLANQR